MADFEILKQSAPGPVCISTNVFSGAVIALASDADAAAATAAAQDLARSQRTPLERADRERKSNCPATCRDGARSSASRAIDEIVNYSIDPNAPLYVSYAYARWRVSVKCPTSRNQYRNLATSSGTKSIRKEIDLVCPGTRVLTGCVLAYAIDTKRDRAQDTAKQLAEDAADAGQQADAAKTCPNTDANRPCVTNVQNQDRPAAEKLWDAHEIKQARQGNVKKYVAYYEAHWKVEIRCEPAPPKGGQEQ